MSFKPVSPKVDFPKLEEDTLQYWKKNKTFEKSLEKEAPNGDWTFLDGPPFVTGLPHYGHLLTSIAKDLFPRFKTMNGYRVRRVWGWDGHGLPVENKVETKLQLKSKRDIEEKVGIKQFIEECKQYVDHISGEWEWYVDHIARWVDFKNAYKTWDLPYMESVMWVFKQMYEKGLVYKGLKNSLYCPHCSTPISNFEVAMDADNYKETVDPSTTYKYQLKDEKDTYILAWSTTPWSKIPTFALTINPKLTYVKVKQGEEFYILAKSTLKMLHESPKYEIIKEFKGKELISKKYIPHFDFFTIDQGKKAYEVIGDDFVTAEEGTGVVTIAPYGEEDLKVMQEHNIYIETHLDEEGTVLANIPQFGGMYYLKASKAVNEDLARRGLIYKDEQLTHRVPLCWRCHTRLYYAAITAWYVNVQKIKEKMKKTNEHVNWIPKHFKHGRFLKSLENAPDWNISRNRYWGSPVPVWECSCGFRFVPGSMQELEEKSGKKITDLHKPEIDEVTIMCDDCGNRVYRVAEVLDSWIEAGSASFGERHYPFGEQPSLDSFYPPDFIVEYTGQIRAWFYVLHVISNALFDKEAFKNVGVTGVILGTDGKKMSKNLGNYPDPKLLIEKYGGDALRLYFMSSPIIQGEDIAISEEQYRNQVKGMMLILWNVYNFFVTYANIDGWEKDSGQALRQTQDAARMTSKNVLDEWILCLLNKLIEEETADLEKYDTIRAIEKIEKFVDDLSTWYIRRSRDRVGPAAEDEHDRNAFYETTWTVLTTFSRLLAPIAPFISEEIYRNLTGEESVHLTMWPEANQESRSKNQELIEEMQIARKVVELGHAKRKAAEIKLRQPLKQVRYVAAKQLSKRIEHVISEELNVIHVEYGKATTKQTEELGIEVTLDTEITPELKAKGEARDIVRKIQEERKKLGTTMDEKIHVTLSEWPKEFEAEIKKKALVQTLTKGETFSVSRV